MKITAGMGAIDDYEALVEAGADEIFCGFVPFSWNSRYGNVLPLNRREVLFYHVQVGTLEDMKILSKKAKKYGVKVSVAFNALYYAKGQLEAVAGIIQDLVDIGFSDFIIADINLIRSLMLLNIPCNIHVSGELGEWNSPTLRMLLRDFSNSTTRISRIIFHRKNSLEDMESIIKTGKQLAPELEYEAFCMNENCHFTGGFCNSLHCDEMNHLCQLEYRLTGEDKMPEKELSQDCFAGAYQPGESGCGLCSIANLEKMGIDYLKIVGRGESAELVAIDIAATKSAILGKVPKNCNRNCYYLENEEK